MLCLVFFVDGLGGWMGETSDCFMGHGARYLGLIYELLGVIQAIKSPLSAGDSSDNAMATNQVD